MSRCHGVFTMLARRLHGVFTAFASVLTACRQNSNEVTVICTFVRASMKLSMLKKSGCFQRGQTQSIRTTPLSPPLYASLHSYAGSAILSSHAG